MTFEPIAIIGQSCTLPDAHTPETLWNNILAGKNCLSAAPAKRWGITRELILRHANDSDADRSWSDVGGYVRDFQFDASGLQLPADELQQLDPLFQLTIQGVRDALRDAKYDSGLNKTGLVLGNLSFPSASQARYAESVWLGTTPRPDARNRFNSGLPAHIAARALGLGAGAFALDAACASSLYAIKLACDRLHDRSADVMVAGAVNQADDLFIHVGFCALSALSKTGQSRPFHRDADGLVPAEGAGFVVLQRLSDALASGKQILGVIRGIGLSNDGRGRGLLAPSEEGQERALRLAYQQAGLTPADISLVECHATGTPVGDATELRSMAKVFAGCEHVPIGSLKSNLGHLITAAGVAGLMKVLAAMKHHTFPPTLHADLPNPALENTPFRLLRQAQPWQGPKRAAISAFGFGGNNAHLIVESVEETLQTVGRVSDSVTRQAAEIAIVGIGARVGNGENSSDFAQQLFSGQSDNAARQTVKVALEGLRFPPNDLQQSLAQQTLVLEAAREAAHGINLPRERTSVLIGMGCDAEVSRCGTRWRLANEIRDPIQLAQARDGIMPPLQAATVVGSMPNIPANRINSQLDVAGPAFTVSAEEASGITALQLAARALSAGEIDAALVGAVDLSHEQVHLAALAELGISTPPADAAVVLTLKRLDDAQRDGDMVYATLCTQTPTLHINDLTPQFGKAHAAHGLLQVAAGALAVHHGARLQTAAAATPWIGPRVAQISTEVLAAQACSITLANTQTASAWSNEAPARLHIYSGNNKDEVLAALNNGQESNTGPARLVIVAASSEELKARSEQAAYGLLGEYPMPDGVVFREAPMLGEVGFVFTGAAAAYAGMGRELALALPQQVAAFATRCSKLNTATDWIYKTNTGIPNHPLDQLWGASFVCQLHAEITQRVLGLRPAAAIGYSSGETNSLFALGVWNDIDQMMAESCAGSTFNQDLVGDFAAPRQVWQRMGISGTGWSNYVIAAPVSQVQTILADEPLVHITIINTADSCVIAGESAACERVIQTIGAERAINLAYDMICHCPEVAEVRDAWWQLHHRTVTPVTDVRFYSNGRDSWYHPTAETAADAITAQAIHTIDFPKTILQAWQDGVRIFIEHGPRSFCSGWIRQILGEREHLTINLDTAGRSGVRQLLNATASMVAAGLDVNFQALQAALTQATPQKPPVGATLDLPAHQATPRRPDIKPSIQIMEPAPYLEPVGANLFVPTISGRVDKPVGWGDEGTPTPLAPTSNNVGVPSSPQPTINLAQHAQITALHQQFITQQSQIHQQYLATQRMAETALLNAYQAAVGANSFAQAPQPNIDANKFAPTPQPIVLEPSIKPLPGPKFSRAQLETLASGQISSVFGAQFESQDGYTRQVRMPEPPLLLADRVTGIDAIPCSMGKGTIWTETDVRPDSWYLDDEGRMPAGVMIESGQADLLLISWLGIDQYNKSERVYRLLGCDLTYSGGLPVPGDTLAYDIHVDGHAMQGDVRLFFFHYDCNIRGKTRLTVRNGQAGFFTDEELANSAGVLWDAREEQPAPAQVDAPFVSCSKNRLSSNELKAFAAGNAYGCFGTGWEFAQTHVRSPRITSEKMQFLHQVTELNHQGGPWQRGYLRAETPVTPNDWFFQGHFKNDPCMPGTLMFEGCLQAMAIYLASLGYTIQRDGWRFEPVPDTKYAMRCRGQVTPTSQHLIYEVFVSEVSAGPIPTVYADLLCTVDGRKAFHARRVGLQLVPDWPLAHWKNLGTAQTQPTGTPVALRQLAGLRDYQEPKPVAVVDGFAFDYHSLLACAWGAPSKAFGPMYTRFDGTRRAARLPGPPYHFMSRVTNIDGPIAIMQQGTTVDVEYDVPVEQWYFEQNGHPTMPFCVIMEAALQPCGWLASFVGSALTTDTDMLFRNLDGTGKLLVEVLPSSGTFKTRVKLLSFSQSAGMIIENFEVECYIGSQRVFEMKTVFGFFPQEAFENQVGLPVTEQDRARLATSGNLIDLSHRPAKYCAGNPRLAGEMLLMLDRIVDFQPQGGKQQLGYLRAEKNVDMNEWFFKAHFFQDPVQPGSLGVEALCQLLQFFMIEQGIGAGIPNGRFEPIMLNHAVTWKYRGQVVPKNKLITTELSITEIGADYVIAEGSLWVDGKRIYEVRELGMRVVKE